MANWYVSSVDYTAVAQWAALHTYAVGNIVRQLAAPAVNSERCFRCTAITTGISGASEPTWNLGDSATTSETTVTWTECTGQGTHQRDNGATVTWTAPAARFACLGAGGTGKNIIATGDSVYLSSDHAETQAAAMTLWPNSNATTTISVSKAGNVPPVAGDITAGAKITTTGANGLNFNCGTACYYEGITFSCGTGSSGASIIIDNNSAGSAYFFKNCAFVIGHTAAGAWLSVFGGPPAHCIWDNTTVQFGAVGQSISPSADVTFEWRNTASAIQGANIPTNLLNMGRATTTCRGVDFSAMGSGKTIVFLGNGPSYARVALETCKLGASVTVSDNPNANGFSEWLDVINCDSGATGYRNEWHRREGNITTETTITRASGATDGVQAVSWKAISTASSSFVTPFEFPPISQWNALTGSSHTATIEIISSATLNNDDIWLDLEYLGSSASPLGSGVNNTIATRLTANAACPTSSVTWNSSPSTPQKQYLQVTFTPQMAGLVVARVKLAKTSATVYVDPLITIA